MLSLTPALRGLRALAFISVAAVAAPLAAQESLPDYVVEAFGTPPVVPEGPLSPELAEAARQAFVESFTSNQWGPDQQAGLLAVAESGDLRLAWLISDMLRFVSGPRINAELSAVANRLMGVENPGEHPWMFITNTLIAWDIPAPPDYLSVKKAMYTAVFPPWERIFAEGDVDWRHVSWGGVRIDDRPYDTTDTPCNCIPAADNPEVIPAAEATYLSHDEVVFGIEVNGEYRAYPRRTMEVREMVNDTLGGRDLGIPYCTLCGAAQAYFTDGLPEGVARPILRTSGLLTRSNKLMYDLTSWSVIDTFRGTALTGPLAERGITLEQATVVTTEWGAWKAAHPDTTVLLERYALGRNPDFRSNRDANGPIFPVGDVDPRLPVQEDVIGAITASGQPVAFQRSKALLVLEAGGDIQIENVRLELDAGGIRAVGTDGEDIGSHQAFWFAWSQFYPETALWDG